jgi:hypothetical protein
MNWLLTALLATIFFAFFALFSRLSTFQNPLISNVIICSTLAICGILLGLTMDGKKSFSKEAFFSGVLSNLGLLAMLYMLVSNQILVVFSFVSFASVVFFLVMLAFDKPQLSRKQKSIAALGILVSSFGLFLASTSTAGGISTLLNSAINPYFLLIAPVIPLGSGLWTYLSFVAIKKTDMKIPTIFLNYSLAAFVTALTAYLILGLSFPAPQFSRLEDAFPIIAGLFVSVGIILTLKSYEATSGGSRIEETIVAVLSNGEIIPLIFLSYFVLREFTVEGLVGAFTVFVGLAILNSARSA